MSDLLNTAAQNERNRERREAWSLKYFELFGVRPTGNIRRHRRCVLLDDIKRVMREI